jgi:hypothetical protein
MAYQDVSDTRALAQEYLNKAINFQQMGMMASAERELAEARRLDPTIVSNSRYQSISAQRAEEQGRAEAMKLPMRVVAIMLLVDAIVYVLLWLLDLSSISSRSEFEFLVWGLVHIGVDVFIAVNLLRLKETATRWTLWWAVVGLIGGLLTSLAPLDMPSIVLQFAYSGALLLLIVGKPSKVRIAIAVVVYVLGYIGGLCGLFAWGVIQMLGS